jgi:hypothetical protein
MANRCTGSADAPILTGVTAPPASEFGAVLARAVMTPAGLTRLLRAHGWRISRGTARGWAKGGSGAKRPPPPPAELLEWLRGVAAHVRRDPLPALAPAEVRSPRGQPAPAALVDWLRRLVAYHHRNPPPPPLAAHWAEGPRTGRLH